MDDQPDEFKSDAAFMAWLKGVFPEWESEYSGHIRDMYDAWEAGRQHQRDEDRLNSDHE